LLVVIAIIALLMGILMPALSAARKQAWGVICQNNLKSTGVAMYLYAEANDSAIPRGVVTSGDKSQIWFTAFMPYLAHNQEQSDYRNVDIYKCPAYPEKRQTVCYVVNAYHPEDKTDITEWDPGDGRFRLFSYKRLSETIYLADNADAVLEQDIVESADDVLDKIDVWSPDHMPSSSLRRVANNRHSRNGYNVLFAAGHVEMLRALNEADYPGNTAKEEEIKLWHFRK
jgi:hypothetical protein